MGSTACPGKVQEERGSAGCGDRVAPEQVWQQVRGVGPPQWDRLAPHSSCREDSWQQCEEVSVVEEGTHTCTFQPRAGSAISILVNVSRPHTSPTLSYFKEPFWLHQAGESQHHRGPCPCLDGRGCSIPCPVPWQKHIPVTDSAHRCPTVRAGDGVTGPAEPAVAATPGGTGRAAGLPGPLCCGEQP